VTEALDGSLLGTVPIAPPRPPGKLQMSVAGLCWDPSSDTFFYRQTTSHVFVQIGLDGQTIKTWTILRRRRTSFSRGEGSRWCPRGARCS